MKTIHLNTPARRAFAKQNIDIAGDDEVARIGKETRSEEQNRKLWPMLADLRNQVEWLNGFTTDDIKLMFLNRLGVEMRFLPTLERQGMFPVGLRSSTLTREQFSGLIELLYQIGGEEGVVWSDPIERPAQVGRNAKRQDRNGLGPKDEHAVAAISGDAPDTVRSDIREG